MTVLFFLPARSDRAHSFFTAESDRLKAKHLSFPVCSVFFLFFLSPSLVCLVNLGLKCSAVTEAWCLDADTARRRRRRKSDPLCQLADAPRWSSVISCPKETDVCVAPNRPLCGQPGARWQQSGQSCRHDSAAQTSCISNGTWLNHYRCCSALRYDIIKMDSRINNALYSSKAQKIKRLAMLSQHCRLELRPS